MTSAKYRFFCPDPDQGFLSEEESGHALRVLRLAEGARIELLDGKGGKFQAEITSVAKKTVCFKITATSFLPNTDRTIHIAIAPTKNNDRFEFFLEKVTEIGIDKITPLLTKNSERKEIKPDKLEKHLVAAIKQSGHLHLPQLQPITGLRDFLKMPQNANTQCFIAHCETDAGKNELFDLLLPSKNVLILIGPEGDFSTEEIALAKNAGFIPVSLGESRLRTETAGIVACLTIHLKK